MAETQIGANSEPVTINPVVARVLSGFDRQELSAFIAIGIEIVDALDGDADLEDDDPSGVHDEDGANTLLGDRTFLGDRGPGCPISDPDGCPAGDDGCAPFLRAGTVHWGPADEDADFEMPIQPAETLNPEGKDCQLG